MHPLPDAASFPSELRAAPSWAAWKLIERDGLRTKFPINVRTGRGAKSNDPTTWATFAEAYAYAQTHRLGLWFFLAAPFVGVDADHCRDRETGELTPLATSVFGGLDTYTEVSVSGEGLKAIAYGKKPGGRCRRAGLALELYDTLRGFALTGQRVPDAPLAINDCQEAIDHIYGAAFGLEPAVSMPRTPGAVIDEDDRDVVAWLEEHTPKFGPLWRGDTSAYDSPSGADQALCNIFAWRIQGDAARIESLFASSGLVRDKWERRPDYRNRTIAKAIDDCPRFWEPARARATVAEAAPVVADERLAVLERENAELRANLAKTTRMLANVMQIRRNGAIKAERDTLTTCILHIAAEQAGGRADGEGWVRQPAKAIADSAGKGVAAVRTHRERGAEWGLLELKVVAEHDAQSGQRRTVTYARTKPTPDEALDVLLTIEPVRETKDWGGQRQPCPHCGCEEQRTLKLCRKCHRLEHDSHPDDALPDFTKPLDPAAVVQGPVRESTAEPIYEVIADAYQAIDREPDDDADDWDEHECNEPGCVRPVVIGQRYCSYHRDERRRRIEAPPRAASFTLGGQRHEGAS